MPGQAISFPIVSRNYSDLQNQSNPQWQQNNCEFLPWTFFDTITSGTTIPATIAYFATVQTDPTLGNLPQAGTLADGQYFEPHYVGFEAIPPVTAASEVNCNNLITLYYVSRPFLAVTYSQKAYGQFPLSHINRPGGFSVQSAIVTHSEAQWNSDGVGLWLMGALIFQPRQTFSFVLNLVSGGTITTAALLTRLSLVGTLYRRIN